MGGSNEDMEGQQAGTQGWRVGRREGGGRAEVWYEEVGEEGRRFQEGEMRHFLLFR